jgi:hypothetical protein
MAGSSVVALPDVGVTSVQRSGEPTAPEGFALSQNYPNPIQSFHNASVSRSAAGCGYVSLKVYDLRSEEKLRCLSMDNMNSPDRIHRNSTHPDYRAASIIYRLTAGGIPVAVKKMLLIR